MTFGAQVDEATASRMVHTCLDTGVVQFDTANSYQNGEAERILGGILREVSRERYFLTTKVGNANPALGPEAGLSPGAIEQAIDASLRRLQVDYVDVYFMHMPDPHTEIEATLEAFAQVVTVGKARHIGISNFAAWQVAYMHGYARHMGWHIPTWGQQMYNLLARRIEGEYLPAAAALDIRTMVYNPLAGGLLTGKYRHSDSNGSRFTRPDYRSRYWTQLNHQAVSRLNKVAESHGMTLTELSLRWLLTRPGVDTVILGASSYRQLLENLAAMATKTLSPDLAAFCDDTWQSLRGVAPDYYR